MLRRFGWRAGARPRCRRRSGSAADRNRFGNSARRL